MVLILNTDGTDMWGQGALEIFSAQVAQYAGQTAEVEAKKAEVVELFLGAAGSIDFKFSCLFIFLVCPKARMCDWEYGLTSSTCINFVLSPFKTREADITSNT